MHMEYPGPRLQTPDFQKKSGVPGPRTPVSRFPEKIWSTGAPDSRLQISRKNLEYRGPGLQTQKNLEYPGPQTPDSRFPEKIWSTRGPRLQTPDFQKESGVPGPQTPDSRLQNLQSRAPGTPDFFWKSGGWRYFRLFLEIWSLESAGTPDFSGSLESGGMEIWSLESRPPPKTRLPEVKCVDYGGGRACIYIYIIIYVFMTAKFKGVGNERAQTRRSAHALLIMIFMCSIWSD